MKGKIGKSILAIVLLVLLVAFAGVDIYMYVIAGDSTKIQTYTGNAKKENEQYNDDEDYNDDYDDDDQNYTSTLKGFSTTGSTTSSGTTDTKAAKASSDDGDFVLPKFRTKYYKKSDLKKLSKSEVRRAVNDIYAFHGYIFTTDENINYYSQMDWYQGTVTSMEDSEKHFNAYEKANKDLLVDYEKKKGWR